MKLSVLIPARDEAGCIETTVREVTETLSREAIEHEVIVVDDASTDRTAEIVEEMALQLSTVRLIRSHYRSGFGLAVRAGIDHFEGDALALAMADGSDDPANLVRYYQILSQGFDCAFGSRFVPGGEIHDYPKLKLAINRLANRVVQILFRHAYNDTTNACKAYRREVIENIQPLISNHFNLTVEMPLKAIVRGHSYAVVPISWRNRTEGQSKLGLKEMGSRYVFSLLYVFLEHHLTKGDYRRPGFNGVMRQRQRFWPSVPTNIARAARRSSQLRN